jgi:hypothetical protein
MKTYLYSEAPELEEETDGDDSPAYPTDDAASFDMGTIHVSRLFAFWQLPYLYHIALLLLSCFH